MARLYPGDSVTVTIGREVYNPQKFSTFEVGPISVTTTVRPDEGAAEAYARASVAARQMFEAEYAMKRREYASRAEETNR